MCNEDKDNEKPHPWEDVAAYSRCRLYGHGMGHFWSPPDDGKIFREHYSVAPDIYKIMPKVFVKWLLEEC